MDKAVAKQLTLGLMALQKQAADPTALKYLDTVGQLPTNVGLNMLMPGASYLGQGASGLAGMMVGGDGGTSAYKSFVPFTGAFRQGQVLEKTQQDYKKRHGGENSNLWHEQVGELPASLLGAGAGALAGYGLARGLSDEHRGYNVKNLTLAGAAAGGALPILAAHLAALATKTRTRKEQDAAESTGNTVADYLVPGVATYNRLKRTGYGYDNLLDKQP